LKTRLLDLCLKLGIGVTSSSNMRTLKENQQELFLLRNYMNFSSKYESIFFSSSLEKPTLSQFANSKAQLNQDLVVLVFLNYLRGGYFVEFGATDGERFSNTHLLEKHFGWNGILAEPGKVWHKSLVSNRSCLIETRCVWKSSGEFLDFNETEVGELSTLDMFSSEDLHSDARRAGRKYIVETISLQDLLIQNDAPTFIDYLSIDTEGSEFEILASLDFTMFSFGFISCEHNYTSKRESIAGLLEDKGYVRICKNQSLFDDWFISKSMATNLGLTSS
jgi:hypothetical protein